MGHRPLLLDQEPVPRVRPSGATCDQVEPVGGVHVVGGGRAAGEAQLAFHISLAGHEPGEIMHADQWWGERVDLDFYYLDPQEVVAGITGAGFVVMGRTDREPWPGAEHESRRCYLLCRRSG